MTLAYTAHLLDWGVLLFAIAFASLNWRGPRRR